MATLWSGSKAHRRTVAAQRHKPGDLESWEVEACHPHYRDASHVTADHRRWARFKRRRVQGARSRRRNRL